MTRGEIDVNVNQVKAALIEGREKHLDEYERVFQRWVAASVEALTERLEQFSHPTPEELGDKDELNLSFALPKPQCFVDEYDTAIAQLEWETRDVISLDEGRFSQWVLGKWGWATQFLNTSSLYQ